MSGAFAGPDTDNRQLASATEMQDSDDVRYDKIRRKVRRTLRCVYNARKPVAFYVMGGL